MPYDKPSNYQPSEADVKKIENAFVYHAPVEDQPDRYVDIREKSKALAYTFTMHCPASRELSLALTKLEEAMMWANASIARNE